MLIPFVQVVTWYRKGPNPSMFLSVYDDPKAALEFMRICEDRGLIATAQTLEVRSVPEFGKEE